MKRSSYITWDQLKVGVLILVALVIIAAAIVKLGQAGNLFGKRYRLVAFVASANGLRVGGQVTVAGQVAGSIKDITVGTPRYRALHEGDTLAVVPSLDYEAVMQQASGAITEVVRLTRDLSRVTGSINRGEGTLGQLVTNRQLYDQLNATLLRTSALMARLENPRGTVGRLLDDPALYNSLTRMIAGADTVLRQINSGTGSVGKLLRDDTLYIQLNRVVARADSLVSTMSNGKGTMNKLFTDEQLYDQLVKTVNELNNVLVEVRRDPRRYTPGMIQVKLF